MQRKEEPECIMKKQVHYDYCFSFVVLCLC